MSGSWGWDARGRGAEYRGHASPCEYRQPCTPDDSDPGCDGCGYAEPEQDAPLAPDDERDVVACQRCHGTGEIPRPPRVRPDERVGHFDDGVFGMACPSCQPAGPVRRAPSIHISANGTVVRCAKAAIRVEAFECPTCQDTRRVEQHGAGRDHQQDAEIDCPDCTETST